MKSRGYGMLWAGIFFTWEHHTPFFIYVFSSTGWQIEWSFPLFEGIRHDIPCLIPLLVICMLSNEMPYLSTTKGAVFETSRRELQQVVNP